MQKLLAIVGDAQPTGAASHEGMGPNPGRTALPSCLASGLTPRDIERGSFARAGHYWRDPCEQNPLPETRSCMLGDVGGVAWRDGVGVLL